MKADFYITYHHADEMAARWIASELKQGKFSTLSSFHELLELPRIIKAFLSTEQRLHRFTQIKGGFIFFSSILLLFSSAFSALPFFLHHSSFIIHHFIFLPFWSFIFWSLGFVSDFDIRISDLFP